MKLSRYILFVALPLYGVAHKAADVQAISVPSIADNVVRSETIIEGLRTPLATLSKSVANLRLPDERAKSVLEERFEFVDLAAKPASEGTPILDLGFTRTAWPIKKHLTTASREDVQIWQELFAAVDFFHHFNFYNIRGAFVGEDRYRTDAGFKGLAQLTTGEVAAIKGSLDLEWQAQPTVEGQTDPEWRLARFETIDFEWAVGPEPLFSDVGDIAFDKASWQRASHSPRDETTVNNVLNVRSGAMSLDEFVQSSRETLEAAGSGILDTTQTVVVDIDRDGFDDFYVTGAGARSVFYRNRGDGTFEEQTDALGLSFEDVHSAMFADLDNDGDADLFLSFFNREGATRYLVNEGGRFVDRTETLGFDLPNFVLPIAASDFNNDGLLDVYLATYVNVYLPAMMAANEVTKQVTGEYSDTMPFLDNVVAREVFRRNRSSGHAVSKAYGPPNWLLINRGNGRFERAHNAGDVNGDFNTLALGWTDFDLDGDMDLYLVSEGGPNELMQNNADGTFTDVSSEVTGEIGFGMGIAVGDYDNDARSDFYTTNMYSKAGLRISEQLGSSDIVVQSARGNTLIRNSATGFEKVSSLDDSGVQVEAADFGWGGGFADLNNDGHLDLYVPAGQLSMPLEVATIGDS